MVPCDLLNGRLHRVICPSPEHPGDRSGKNASVKRMPDGGVLLQCHSHGCSYSSIADGLAIELPRRSKGKSSHDRWLIAVYDHPDGVPRKVYRRDWPRDFPEAPAICTYVTRGEECRSSEDPHKHIWGYGSMKGTHLLLWGDDAPDNTLVVVEGEKAAAALMIAANAQGYTPVSWRGGAGKEGVVNWSRVKGRFVVLWPDNHDTGIEAMGKAARRAIDAEAEALQMVDLGSANLPDKGDAADLRADEIIKMLKSATDYAPPLIKPESTEGGRRVSVLKRQEGAPVNLG